MCLTLPARIKSIKNNRAELDDGRSVDLSLVKNSQAGDWLLASQELAVAKISSQEAEETLRYFKTEGEQK